MLALMCPNCRHRFPAPGCCNPAGSVVMQTSSGDQFSTSCGGSYCNGNMDYLVSRGYSNGGGTCVVNGPTNVSQSQNDRPEFMNTRWIQEPCKNRHQSLSSNLDNVKNCTGGITPHCQISNNTCSVTVANEKTTRIEEDEETLSENSQRGIFQNPHPMLFPAPSGCQELPGLQDRNNTATTTTAFNFQISEDSDWTRTKNLNMDSKFAPNLIQISSTNANSSIISSNNTSKTNLPTSPTVIQVNATLQLPPNVAHCTVSITATANTTMPGGNWNNRIRNNFNGGGIVETDSFANIVGNHCERDDNSPTTPVSWVLPFPWGVNGNTGNNSTDLERLSAAQRVLQISGWYHEGLSWQQSAALLKNSPVGSWLMRDSSDKRYMYAVSVQTARGPTAVRVHYVCGKFRLDAEPRMAPLMPMFECPVKMIEHYIEYSKKMSEQKEVWVDHSGQLYSQIYLTKPLLKEVRSLSHLARLAVNRSNISTKELPNPLKEYIADYPYTE